jgi:hypothetical protein
MSEHLSDEPITQPDYVPQSISEGANAAAKPLTRVCHPKVISAADLMKMQFPEPKWLVPNIIPERLTILSGAPKMGKSWMVLEIAIAVASGRPALGLHTGVKAEVLYLALEDDERRLQLRIEKLSGGRAAPKGLHLSTQWKRLNEGGLEDLRQFLEEHPAIKLVAIDTLQKVRGPSKSSNVYSEDYKVIGDLKQLGDDLGISILLVHHLKKAKEEDVFDQISGSTGVSGAADTLLVLDRIRGNAAAKLHVTGRDVEENAFALSFDKETGRWAVEGAADLFELPAEQQAVINLLAKSGPLKPKDLAAQLSITDDAARQRLYRMAKDGTIQAYGNGLYGIIEVPSI